MIIKKFLGRTEEEALAEAKKELGENVVLMNVKNIKKGGFLGFMQKQVTEITVALEEESERRGKDAVNEKALKEAVSAVAQVAARAAEPEKFTVQPQVVKPQVERTQETSGQKNRLTETLDYIERKDNTAIQEKLDSLQSLLELKLQPQEEEEASEEDNEMMVFMKLLYNTMLDNEVKEVYANQVIEEADKVNKPNTPVDAVLATVYQKMILKLGKPEIITPAETNPKVIFFIGPTGVGKTTTIAKIASKFCLEDKKRFAMLTCDTYLIAAAEQLRTYASILEIPFEIIYTTEEMKEAAVRFKDFDYIFVDTAGHSYQNEEQREAVKAFIQSVDDVAESETYLVVSSTTKYRDLEKIADSYKTVADYKLIFTKLDETSALGSIFNLRLHTGAALSYVTSGQNVPNDIEEFNPQKTVKNLLGGKN